MVSTNPTKVTAEPGKQEVRITREFDAPRELVFRAFTDPKLYIQWLGPRRLEMVLEKFEARSGGSWRYIHKDPNGDEYAFHGVYHDITAPSRIVGTFEFEGAPGHVSLDTAHFEEHGGKTLLTLVSVFQSVEDRDAMYESGMESGMNESMERLDELLARM